MAKFKISTIVDNDAAVARVTVKVGNKEVVHTGSSKRHPKDRVDKTTGEALAVARALAKAQADVEAYATQRVDQAVVKGVTYDFWGTEVLEGLKPTTMTFTAFPTFQGA